MTFYQDCSSRHDSSKKHGRRGRGDDYLGGGQCLFCLYIYIKNFKNLLVRHHWTNFNITWQEGFLGDPVKIVQAIMIRQKTWLLVDGVSGWGVGGVGLVWGAYFPFIYLYRKLLKSSSQKLLYQYSITWQ